MHLPQLYCHVCEEERRLFTAALPTLGRIVGLVLIDYLLISRHIGRELAMMGVKRDRVDAWRLSSMTQRFSLAVRSAAEADKVPFRVQILFFS